MGVRLWGGHISEALKNAGYDVFSSDLINRGYNGQNETIDFLEHDKNVYLQCDIITNPPYKYAKEFVEKALDIIDDGYNVAMFLKLTFLEGEKRRSLFEKYPPKKIYVFSKRINCALNGDEAEFKKPSAVCYAWFIWQKGNKNKPVIDWI